jgi:hypothetical protein
MSESEESEENQADAQEALIFYRALRDFFVKEPRSMIWVLHVVADETSDALKEADSPSNEIQQLMGRIDTVQELFWNHDRYDIVLNTIIKSDVQRAFMRAIALLADAYSMIKGDGSLDTSALRDRLDDATHILYAILKAVIDMGEAKTCENQDP